MNNHLSETYFCAVCGKDRPKGSQCKGVFVVTGDMKNHKGNHREDYGSDEEWQLSLAENFPYKFLFPMNSDPFQKPEGESGLKWKFLLYKRYFDTGYGLTGYIKYLIALFGISSLNVVTTLALGIIYAGICFVIGYYWYKKQFVELDNEISNRFNLFMREMREKIK